MIDRFFLFLNKNIYCGLSLEPSESDGSNDGSQNTFFVASALAGRHRRASFRPFVCLSFRTFIHSYVRLSVHPSTFNMGIL